MFNAKERPRKVTFEVMEYRNGRNVHIGYVTVDDNASAGVAANNKAMMLYRGRRVWAQPREEATTAA